jgi:diacylglycerol kinase family enzyme
LVKTRLCGRVFSWEKHVGTLPPSRRLFAKWKANNMQRKFNILINGAGGTVLRLGQDYIRLALQEALGDQIETLTFSESGGFCDALQSLNHHSPTHDLLVGGGDGTAVCAAEHLAGHGVPFGVLPLGTMNLLAQDLGAAPTFEESLKRFKGFQKDKIDLGIVNDRFFLCSAVIGLVPESATLREELRDEVELGALTRFIGTIARGMSGADKKTLKLTLHESDEMFTLETTSLIVSNNRFLQKPEFSSERFLRETLKDGKLAVYSAAPEGMMDGLRLILKMAQGAWQEDDAVLSFETPSLSVTGQEEKILISLDGEPLEMTSPLKFSIQPESLPVLRMELAA